MPLTGRKTTGSPLVSAVLDAVQPAEPPEIAGRAGAAQGQAMRHTALGALVTPSCTGSYVVWTQAKTGDPLMPAFSAVRALAPSLDPYRRRGGQA